MVQVREDVFFTKGRIIVRGKLVTRRKAKKADFVPYYKPNIPIALIETKDNNHRIGDSIQQARDYAATLDTRFVFSSNGDGFIFPDRTGQSTPTESNLALDAFPSPAELWARYRAWKGPDLEAERIVLQDYDDDGSVSSFFIVRTNGRGAGFASGTAYRYPGVVKSTKERSSWRFPQPLPLVSTYCSPTRLLTGPFSFRTRILRA